MKHQVNEMGTAAGLSMTAMGLGVILAVSISVAFHVPKSRLEMIGLVSSGITGVVYLGAFVIDLLSTFERFAHLSLDSQMWVRIFCGVPLWFAWQILAVQMEKWKSSKNPIQQIRRDFKK